MKELKGKLFEEIEKLSNDNLKKLFTYVEELKHAQKMPQTSSNNEQEDPILLFISENQSKKLDSQKNTNSREIDKELYGEIS